MKRIICTVKDEDVVKIVGTLIRSEADFVVETISAPEPTNVRHLQRKTADGRSASDVIIDELTTKGKRTLAQLSAALVEVGFNKSTVHGTTSNLQAQGLVTKSGGWVHPAKSLAQLRAEGNGD